jgi:hypothetical protein
MHKIGVVNVLGLLVLSLVPALHTDHRGADTRMLDAGEHRSVLGQVGDLLAGWTCDLRGKPHTTRCLSGYPDQYEGSVAFDTRHRPDNCAAGA